MVSKRGMAAVRLGDLTRPFYAHSDPRTRDWFLVGNPAFITLLIGGYLYIVYRAGPRWMANRKPFDLKPVIRVYNVGMIVANLYFGYIFLTNSYLGGNYSFFCQGLTYTSDKHSMAILGYGYWYFYVRVADFMDTFFFVLRKKENQITLQHTLHHTLVVFNGWLWFALGCDGQPMFGMLFNMCVHVIMYTYYFLAACGPEYRKYLWWKKHLTTLQIYQHIIIMIHALIPIFYDCGYPRIYLYIGIPQGLLGLGFFLRFYVLAYTRKGGVPQGYDTNLCILKED
ncbi:very long chain fatty acid elongase 7-like [Ornithodoros turicata]|uniref:very long chain fatty acid elongase 7-like n=1 Tax=Ornithodoros turicata TaxID=34597 RepID=UPI0031394904